MFGILEADIVIMQELKIQRKDLTDDMVLVPGWDVYFSLPKFKKVMATLSRRQQKREANLVLGYSGVGIYTRNSTCAPIRAEEGITGILRSPKTGSPFRDLPEDQQIGGYPRLGQLSSAVDEASLDSEGRCVVLEFPGFVLLGVYSPANRDESRDDFRLGFLEALDIRIRNLISEGKQVVLAGDLNVVRSPLDSTNVAENLRKGGLTIDEWQSMPSRQLLNRLVFNGYDGEDDSSREQAVLWDLTRYFHPKRQGMNTCWDTKKNTRPANFGSRIDYILCSDGLKGWFSSSDIQEGLMGSDHCPVFADAMDARQIAGIWTFLSDIVNPTGMFSEGERQYPWSQRDLLSLSAKLIPEFNGRQSIRDMFSKQTYSPSSLPFSGSKPGNRNVASSVAKTESDGHATKLAATTEVDADTVGESHDSAIALQQPLATKRAAVIPEMSSRSKRPKSTAHSGANASPKKPSGQQTLQTFFQSRNPSRASPKNKESATKPADGSTALPATSNFAEQPGGESAVDSKARDSARKVFDPIEAKESWSRLLGKRTVPRCEHDEPCISLVTKKPGLNNGESMPLCKLTPKMLVTVQLQLANFELLLQEDHSTSVRDHLGPQARRKKIPSGGAVHLFGVAIGTVRRLRNK